MGNTDSLPIWSGIVDIKDSWYWHSKILVEVEALNQLSTTKKKMGIGNFIVDYLYGRQNRCSAVRKTIASAICSLPNEKFGLNFGSGARRYLPNILNLDLSAGINVDLVSAGTLKLPFVDSSLNLIICQEVLEHVDRPLDAIAEFHRSLHSDGELVLQLPWIIGYHPGPKDFWRFSTESYSILLPAEKWEILEKKITVGHGSGMHRIVTEFVAVHFSVFGKRIYRVAKGLSALVFFPLVLLDSVTPFLPERDRIAGGYIVRARPLKLGSLDANNQMG
jgi:SAM-dependent methyltransferase